MKKKLFGLLVMGVMSCALAAGCADTGTDEAGTETAGSVDNLESSESAETQQSTSDEMVNEAESDDLVADESGDEDYGLMMNSEEILGYGDVTYLDVYDAEGEITWSCSDPSVVGLEEFDDDNSYVMVTGLKAGKATVAAYTEAQGEVTCEITVYSRGLYLQDDRGNIAVHSSGTYALGKEHTYTAYIDGEEVDASSLTWASMDENIATVSDDGTVSMVGEGITYIYAADADGSKAYAGVWVSDTDDEWEYETTIPGCGMYFDGMFVGFEEYVLSHIEGESMYYSIYSVYDDGEEIDASTLEWSVENLEGEPFEIDTDDEAAEDPDEHVSIRFSGEAGKAFLTAANPATGHKYEYLIVVVDVD